MLFKTNFEAVEDILTPYVETLPFATRPDEAGCTGSTLVSHFLPLFLFRERAEDATDRTDTQSRTSVGTFHGKMTRSLKLFVRKSPIVYFPLPTRLEVERIFRCFDAIAVTHSTS